MDSTTITAISEMAKLIIVSSMSYMRTQGATEAQIDEMYAQAKADVFSKDPANIPD